jgi:hypothetical protein
MNWPVAPSENDCHYRCARPALLLMNSLATRHPATALAPRDDLFASSARSKESQGTLFLAASLAVHVGLLVFFSSVPGPAMAATTTDIEFEISVEPAALAPFEQQVPSELPLGSLNAPLAPAHETPSRVPSATPPLLRLGPPAGSRGGWQDGRADRPHGRHAPAVRGD